MATNVDDTGIDRSIIRLEIDYRTLPDAREAGEIVRRLANGYASFCHARGARHERLAIETLEVGSLIARLKAVTEIAGATIALIQNGEHVVPFLQQIAVVVQSAQVGTPIYLPPWLRSLLKSLVAPLQQKRATHVRLTPDRLNAPTIDIHSDDVDAIIKILKAQTEPKSVQKLGGEHDTEANVPANTGEKMDEIIEAVGLSSHRTNPEAIEMARLIRSGFRLFAEPNSFVSNPLLPVSEAPAELFAFQTTGDVDRGEGYVIYEKGRPVAFRLTRVMMRGGGVFDVIDGKLV